MDVVPDISVPGADGGDGDPDSDKESVSSDHSDGLGTTGPGVREYMLSRRRLWRDEASRGRSEATDFSGLPEEHYQNMLDDSGDVIQLTEVLQENTGEIWCEKALYKPKYPTAKKGSLTESGLRKESLKCYGTTQQDCCFKQ